MKCAALLFAFTLLASSGASPAAAGPSPQALGTPSFVVKIFDRCPPHYRFNFYSNRCVPDWFSPRPRFCHPIYPGSRRCRPL